jgi:putative DNA primase/helicase
VSIDHYEQDVCVSSVSSSVSSSAAVPAALAKLNSFDRDTVLRTVELLYEPGEIIEVRVLRDGAPPLTGFFDNQESLVAEVEKIEGARGIYITPNPVNGELFARSPNKVTVARSGECSSDSDIVTRRFLLIDVDPVRPTNLSATDAEKDAAFAILMLVASFLSELGFPPPIVADSGNGGHLIYRIDLPTNDEGLVRAVLKRLDELFSDSGAKVDTSVHNPARIWKLYGTLARKGKSTAERPHRMARIISAPEQLQIVDEATLRAFAGPAVVTTSTSSKPDDVPSRSSFDVDAFIQKYDLKVDGPTDWQDGGRKWKMKHSPMCSHHNDGPFIVQFSNGAISAGCHHDSCKGKWGWHDLRFMFDPPTSKWTDAANAARLVEAHGETIRYCHEWKKWIIWDGRRWKVDRSEAILLLAKQTASKILEEARRAGSDEGFKWAKRSESRERLNAMVALAQCEVPVQPEELDTQPWLLNCSNGTLDLQSGVLREHRKEDYLTKMCDVEFDSGAESPLWDQFLCRIFEGDASLMRYVQQLIGVAMVGKVAEHILPIFYGVGANGKSVLLNTLLTLLGTDYAMKAPSNFLVSSKSTRHPTELADLHGKRIVAALETEDGARLSESLVKELTGGDIVRARRMREDFWEFTPSHTMFLATNHKPSVTGTDNGMWRRLKIVPFNAVIPEHEQDKELATKLEHEFPGILRWMVEGCMDWQEDGLIAPDQVETATENFRSDMDRLGEFLAECCLEASEATASAQELYNVYKSWSYDRGESPDTQTAFGTRLRERGFGKTRLTSGAQRGKTAYFGLELSLAV